MQTLQKILAVAIILSLGVASLSYAQETVSQEETENIAQEEVAETVIEEETVTTEEVSEPLDADVSSSTEDILGEDLHEDELLAPLPPPPPATTEVQQTYNVQQAVSGDVLESTANPQATSTEGTVVPLVPAEKTTEEETGIVLGEATSTDVVEETTEEIVLAGPASLEIVDVNITEQFSQEPAADVISLQDTSLSVAVIVKEELPPEFEFVLTGKKIPARKLVRQPDGSVIEEEMEELDPIIGDGVLTVSGACSDVYFVVLLFKNAEDYETDPRSYILNKAYPCVDQKFAYSIAELPSTLESGTYYLLVGQQGERGAWTPITSLTEITINSQ